MNEDEKVIYDFIDKLTETLTNGIIEELEKQGFFKEEEEESLGTNS